MSFANCDSNALPTTTRATSLIPNQFHKFCPPQKNTPFGQPSCGDGTPYSFFFSRPPKVHSNNKKLLIEFQGGGACWNSNTCALQSEYLTYPYALDEFIGKSCSEIQYGIQTPISMLCSKSIGHTDFSQYNTIILPYCTQDVHLGDFQQSYQGTSSTVRHVGAHNMLSVLEWMYDNFPDPSHIFLTGCSAGGTAVPIAYDLIQKHYNSVLRGNGLGMKSVDIGVVMDSSVYLTPKVFLENYIENWGVESIMSKIGFNFEKYRYQSNYPDILWQHILRRGPNSDKWGFVTHSSDPISLMYYQYMSGNNDNERLLTSYPEPNNTQKVHLNRRLEDDLQTEWWTGIQTSMSTVKQKHGKNVDFYIIDGEGHCSFGLYYPLQDQGFEEWVAPIVKENRVVANKRPSAVAFICSIAMGGLLLLAALSSMKQKNQRKLLDDDASLNESRRVRRISPWLLQLKELAIHQASRYSTYPWTAVYLFSCTLYFVCMLISQGFAHPLDNPTLGPSAVGLSSFGINNPSLVVYRMEQYRLVASTFLCSGVITYLLVAFSMYRNAAVLESTLLENNHPHWTFALVAAMISLGVNLFYVIAGKGATSASLALVIGLNVFSGVLQRRSSSNLNTVYPAPWGFTIFWAIVGSTPLFPFDSVVAISTAVVIGAVLGMLLFDNSKSDQTDEDYQMSSDSTDAAAVPSIRWNAVKCTGGVYLLWYLLILFRVPSPYQSNVYPYLTGCNLVYSDQIGDFIKQYANGYGGGRKLEGTDDYFNGQNMCAQLCVPHLVHRPLVWGVRKLGLLAVEEGTCEENGYDDDKTMREYTVTLEVQVFTQSEN